MCAREEGPHKSTTMMTMMMWEGGRECEGQRGSKRMRLVAVSVVLSCLLLLARCHPSIHPTMTSKLQAYRQHYVLLYRALLRATSICIPTQTGRRYRHASSFVRAQPSPLTSRTNRAPMQHLDRHLKATIRADFERYRSERNPEHIEALLYRGHTVLRAIIDFTEQSATQP